MNTSGDHDPKTWPPAPIVELAAKRSDTGPPSWRAALASAPLEMVLFLVFAVAVSVGESWLTFLGPKQWREAAYPYTGGTGIMPYGFCIFFAWQMIFKASDRPQVQRTIPLLLLLGASFGVFSYLMRPRVNFHNPYLTVSPWQPLWTVALPLAWAVILSICPTIRRHRSRGAGANGMTK